MYHTEELIMPFRNNFIGQLNTIYVVKLIQNIVVSGHLLPLYDVWTFDVFKSYVFLKIIGLPVYSVVIQLI